MTCNYCRAQNHSDDHRCSRCGRRLSDEPAARPAMFPVQQSAAAPKLDTVEAPAPLPAIARPGPQLVREVPVAPVPASREVVQPSLFGPMEVAKSRAEAAAQATHVPRPRPPRKRPDPTAQGTLDFDATADGSRALPTSVEAAVYCNAPVAPATQRMIAGAIDVLVPLAGFAAFGTAFQWMVGGVELNSQTLPFLGAAAVLIMAFYRLVCCLGNMDTPGVQWAGMRLLDFDGRIPTRAARMRRIAGGCLSTVSACLGLLWALVDEEHLTWHDHMSGTFPTTRYRS